MSKKAIIVGLAVVVCAGVANADWVSMCDFGRPCNADPAGFYVLTEWPNPFDLLNWADDTDTTADIDLTLSYYTAPGGNCNRVNGAGTDGTWDANAQCDGQAWPGGYRCGNLDPDLATKGPWTYEIYFTSLNAAKVYDFEFYANCPAGYGWVGDGISRYTIAGNSVQLRHTDNYSPSNTVSINGIAPYTFQAITGWTDNGDGTYSPQYTEKTGIKLELADYSIINILRVAEVPEPATLVILGLGGLGLLVRRKR